MSAAASAHDHHHADLAKVPAVTLGFWLIKILATTLGETASDTVTMSMNLGYLAGTGIFAVLLAIALTAQIRASRLHPFLFWAVIVATTTVGTTLADLCDRSLGIGYLGGSALLFALLMLTLFAWHRSLGSVSIKRLDTRAAEIFYWVTILFSQTLGTALGDWVADPETGWGFGYGGGAALFGAGLLVVVALYFWTRTSRTALFWAAFILTRPLGATVGDYLDKPVANGGLALSRYTASGTLVVCMLLLVILLPQRAERLQRAPHD
ncbi:COG4705 family protein [Massilia putida]|uniref:COG4705 family protein n=1 Tax=Massilia putida TaxID=1141883 RepID=UPI00095278CF|nr:hypothetical protein [Massilia putida]